MNLPFSVFNKDVDVDRCDGWLDLVTTPMRRLGEIVTIKYGVGRIELN